MTVYRVLHQLAVRGLSEESRLIIKSGNFKQYDNFTYSLYISSYSNLIDLLVVRTAIACELNTL